MFTYAVLSEVGEREINEDSVGFAPVGKDIGMVILADGLGGHGRGEDASALVTTASKEVFRYYYNQKDCLERCFMESQKRLMKKQADENARQDLKTTLVLLRIVNGYVQWGHVGDSRLYYFKKNKLQSAVFLKIHPHFRSHLSISIQHLRMHFCDKIPEQERMRLFGLRFYESLFFRHLLL